MKQSNRVAKWCQVELAKCELRQRENLHLAKKEKKSFGIQMGNTKLPTQKVHSFSYLGAILLLNFPERLIATHLYSKLKVASQICLCCKG